MCDSDRVIIYARFGIWRSKLILVERGGTVGGEACVYWVRVQIAQCSMIVDVSRFTVAVLKANPDNRTANHASTRTAGSGAGSRSSARRA